MFLLIARRVRAGAWTNYDVSVREQRTGMYPVALAITVATALVLAWSRFELGRHTLAEVLGGALLGALVGGGSFLW